MIGLTRLPNLTTPFRARELVELVGATLRSKEGLSDLGPQRQQVARDLNNRYYLYLSVGKSFVQAGAGEAPRPRREVAQERDLPAPSESGT